VRERELTTAIKQFKMAHRAKTANAALAQLSSETGFTFPRL